MPKTMLISNLFSFLWFSIFFFFNKSMFYGRNLLFSRQISRPIAVFYYFVDVAVWVLVLCRMGCKVLFSTILECISFFGWPFIHIFMGKIKKQQLPQFCAFILFCYAIYIMHYLLSTCCSGTICLFLGLQTFLLYNILLNLVFFCSTRGLNSDRFITYIMLWKTVHSTPKHYSLSV